MALPFRQRIFLILGALTAVPTALAVVGWALAVRTVGPSAGARVALEEDAASARQMIEQIDTTRLTSRQRVVLRQHLEQLSNSVSLARRAETYLRYYAGSFAAVVIVFGTLALISAIRLAGHLSRQLSRPIDELVGWTRLIRRRMPLPAGPPTHGAPEFEALRQALRELVTALDQAREKELEAERLRAFREVARRVAHEIKNPLTAMRIGVGQLRRGGGQADGQTATAVDVLAAETERLERLAKEFAEFGRLPEGPKSEVDLVDLLVDLAKSAVPPAIAVTVRANGGPCTLLGQYDPLRRARSEEHTSELQSHHDLVCRLLLEKKKHVPPQAIRLTWRGPLPRNQRRRRRLTGASGFSASRSIITSFYLTIASSESPRRSFSSII